MIMISNFVENQQLNVGTSFLDKRPLVYLHQSAGSTSFTFSMRPEQARAMAVHLVQQADEVDLQASNMPDVVPAPASSVEGGDEVA